MRKETAASHTKIRILISESNFGIYLLKIKTTLKTLQILKADNKIWIVY
jgi:hypothetical protein